MTDLSTLQQHWDAFGKRDPLWAVLTHDGKDGGRWDREEFFATGRADVARTLAEITALGLSVPRGHALDFGCGVGRLSQALAEHFDRVTGLDIAPAMIERARLENRCGERVSYGLNATDRLPMLADGSVDFALTFIVLQHMPSTVALGYVDEFLRVLSPDGAAVFQMPRRATRWTIRVRQALRRWMPATYRKVRDRLRDPATLPGGGVMEMHSTPERAVRAAVDAAGGRVVRVVPDVWSGPGYDSVHYIVTRRDQGI